MNEPRIKALDLAFRRCRSPVRGALYGLSDMVRAIALRSGRQALRRHEFWALNGVSFDVAPGEAIGVIGPNGAGKTTLVKLLGGLLKPARGSVRLCGHVEAVIELGAVLDPLLSGRENAQIGARLRGFDGASGRDFVAGVEEFAEIGEPFDAPVLTYSSGMQARVAFALAAVAKPDILVVDEALAVGDHAFQRRCVGFIRQMLANGGSLIFVSHNNFQVQSLCERGIYLEGGEIAFSGSAADAVRTMLDRSQRSDRLEVAGENDDMVRLVRFGAESGGPAQTGEPAELVIEYSLAEARDDVSWGFEIWTADEQLCIASAQDMRTRSLAAGRGELRCTMNAFPLVHGRYVLRLNLADLMIVAPIALSRLGLASEVIEVRSPPSIVTNFHVERGQITTLDVDWA